MTFPTAGQGSAVLQEAAQAGFTVWETLPCQVNPSAARMLPADCWAVGVDVAGDVLLAAADKVPSPAEFQQLMHDAGMLVSLAVTTPELLRVLQTQIPVDGGGAPRAIGPALAAAATRGASDVHLSVGKPPVVRVAGEFTVLTQWPALSRSDLESAAKWVAGEDFGNFSGDMDLAITYAGNRWRVALYQQRGSLAMALRRIPADVPRLEDLSVLPSVVDLADLGQGLVLFCGPTGSGKSTTMAALIDRINRTRRCHILTVEDPIEYLHEDRVATVHQREVGSDTESFATGLRHALRQDPDVILVGEMRDLETMRTALAAAETGHLVFATVHATSTSEVFNRLIGAFPGDEQPQVRTQLAASLRAVVAQLLLPALTPGRRQLVTEVMVVTPAIRAHIRDNEIHQMQSALDMGVKDGMTSMDRSLALAVTGGRVGEEVASRFIHDRKAYEQHRERGGTLPSGAGSMSLSRLDDLDDLDRTPGLL